ncbi:MAG: hypothetical protein PHT40_01735 [Patescibacteria group bacterium]|nr:hypothetical protein [Patescibacteria group bacterium]
MNKNMWKSLLTNNKLNSLPVLTLVVVLVLVVLLNGPALNFM